MKTKAIKDLCQLSDGDLFQELFEGLDQILANAVMIYGDARRLQDEKRPRGANILRTIAEEEAAKSLVLMDVARCPRQPSNIFARQLSYFDNHLAKGIYARYCYTKPSKFGEIKKWIEWHRQEFYLDGEMGVEWIFYNEILQRREAVLYVDYIESDGDHSWVSPLNYEKDPYLSPILPPSLQLAHALYSAGIFQSKGLAIVADVWRPIAMTDNFSWVELKEINSQMLDNLKDNDLLQDHSSAVLSTIIDKWLFPLHSLDLSRIPIDQNDLQRIRDNWDPG